MFACFTVCVDKFISWAGPEFDQGPGAGHGEAAGTPQPKGTDMLVWRTQLQRANNGNELIKHFQTSDQNKTMALGPGQKDVSNKFEMGCLQW